MKELIESLTLEALIRGVNEHAFWRKLYALPKKKKSLLNMKQSIKNHIWMKEVLVCYDLGLFVFTRTSNMKDLPSEIILLVEMDAREITMKDQPMIIWCILRIYISLELK